MQLRVLEYLPMDKKTDKAEEIALVEYYQGSKRLGMLQLFKDLSLTPPALSPSETADKSKEPEQGPAFFALSDNTHAMVKISRSLAEEVSKELETLLKM